MIRSLLVGLCLAAVAACGSTTVSELSSPSNQRCASSVTGVPGSVTAGGGEFAATVATARECAWTVETDAAWVQITPHTGQGETAVAVMVAENPNGISRSATIAVNGAKLPVQQDAAACRIAWNAPSVDVPAAGGTVTIGVAATPGCPWQASPSPPWLRGTRTSGTGNGSAEYVASANPDAERTATLRLGDTLVEVNQTSASSGEPSPPTLPGSPTDPNLPPPPPPPPQPLIATYAGTRAGIHNFDTSGTLSLDPGTYVITFNRAGTIVVRGVAGGGGGGGGKRRDDGGSVTAGGGGGGGGAANVSGQTITVEPLTSYQAVVGTGGTGGAGATEGSGNVAGNGSSGSQSYFRTLGGTFYVQLAGGSGGSGGTTVSGPGGGGGSVSAGAGVPGGAGGNGGAFGSAAAQPGGGTSGFNTGGGGGGGNSNEQSSKVGGAPGAAGGASGGAGGNGAFGGPGSSGTSDSGAGGEGARDVNSNDSAGGGGGGGKGLTVAGGPSNRGGGGGGGGAINTDNSADRGGGGGAGGNGGMSIGIR